MAVPTVVRASGMSGKAPVTSRVAAAPAADMFLKLDGLISLNFQKVDWTYKMTPAQCRSLVVTARAGVDGSGPIITKTNATPGKVPGTCVYSMKVPAGQDVSVGVVPFSWAADKTRGKSASDAFIKIGDIKGESSTYKFFHKDHVGATQANLPLYIKLAPRQ
jgi:hypothetical protein